MEAGSQMMVTPFDPTLAGVAPLPPLQSTGLAPVGLTSKELARLRSAATRSPLTSSSPSSSASQPIDPPTISTTERNTATAPPTDTRRLQIEMETLRGEMQELRAERFAAPPSYRAGGGI
ncbi:hypothetical protein EDB84DRAFT_1565341 [Lactarius hengduanensis]|nr:hypothetical protein EDB84DRAFT_1565341 [Lactarius hengduanensis]